MWGALFVRDGWPIARGALSNPCQLQRDATFVTETVTDVVSDVTTDDCAIIKEMQVDTKKSKSKPLNDPVRSLTLSVIKSIYLQLIV